MILLVPVPILVRNKKEGEGPSLADLGVPSSEDEKMECVVKTAKINPIHVSSIVPDVDGETCYLTTTQGAYRCPMKVDELHQLIDSEITRLVQKRK